MIRVENLKSVGLLQEFVISFPYRLLTHWNQARILCKTEFINNDPALYKLEHSSDDDHKVQFFIRCCKVHTFLNIKISSDSRQKVQPFMGENQTLDPI